MNGFERRKEQKKSSIRQAAMELFKVHGFDKVSIGDIARKARVSHVTIYNHFGSKEELVKDVIKTAVQGLVDLSREIIESDRPFLEKLNLIVFNKARIASQYQGELMKLVIRDYPEMQGFIEELWQQQINPIFDTLIAEGKKLKYIHPDISQKAIRYFFEIIRNGAFADTRMLDKLEVDEKLAHDLNYLFIFGLIEKQE